VNVLTHGKSCAPSKRKGPKPNRQVLEHDQLSIPDFKVAAAQL
jgi:hypothetical protein